MFRRRILEGGVGRAQMTSTPAPGNIAGTGSASGGGSTYIMRQRMFALGDDFYINDANGQPKFKVDGQVLRVRNSLRFCDMQGNELLHLQERLVRVRESMSIYRANTVVAKVHNAIFDPLRERFQIEIPGGQEMSTVGKIVWAEYSIQRGGREVAHVTKGFSWIGRDQYGVQIAPGEDDILMLAITVCLDMMVHEGR